MTWRPRGIPTLAVAIVVAAVGCGGEPAEPATPAAVIVQPAETQPVETATAARRAAEPTATVVATLVPTKAAEPEAAVAARAAATAAAGGVQPLPRPTVPGVDLHDSQVITSVGRMRSTMAPWRDLGGNRLFSTHVFGTPFMLNEEGDPVPWIATAITSNDDLTVWTMKLREDAVFQDGTPITAADFKAYWEHGAKPENIVSWGGTSLTLGDIKGWDDLRLGDVTEAEGLRAIDAHTLEIETEFEKYECSDTGGGCSTTRTPLPMAAWPFHMATWHVGISKLDQVLANESWGNAPIDAGPFSLTYDPATGHTELTRVDLVGMHWKGPNDTPIIERLVLPNIEDEQARLVMFENGELDVMSIDIETYTAALDPGHPFKPLLYESSYGGLWFIRMRRDWEPLEDLLVRKALAHSVDMESVVRDVWGPTATHAKGVISSLIPCHNPDASYQPYDPDLARELLPISTYGSASALPPLKIDLSRPDMLKMGRQLGAYWKDNLGIDLDILELKSGQPRREDSQLYRPSWESWIPDPSHIVGSLEGDYRPIYLRNIGYHLPITVPLLEHARALPLDHPDRCAAFQAVEWEYLDKAYIIPIREVDPARWVVQPWLRGFESTFNLDFNTLTTAYVVRH